MMIEKITNNFPYPFKIIAKQFENFSFDYRLNNGQDDHQYLKQHCINPLL